MEKLTFNIPRPARQLKQTDRAVVRITPQAYNLVEAISAQTGLSNAFIASRMIEYAASNTEVVLGFEDGD